MASMNIVYKYFDQHQMYINITNQCTNRCTFCIRNNKEGVGGDDLWLDHEPDFEEIKAALLKEDLKNTDEIVFCGYGEPTMRHEILIKTAKFIKEHSDAKIRINTNGHGNLINGYDITEDYVGLIDEVSVSLNAKSSAKYQEICKCKYGEEGFFALLNFATCAKNHIDNVVLSVVDVLAPEEIEACKEIAESAGVKLRVRHLI